MKASAAVVVLVQWLALAAAVGKEQDEGYGRSWGVSAPAPHPGLVGRPRYDCPQPVCPEPMCPALPPVPPCPPCPSPCPANWSCPPGCPQPQCPAPRCPPPVCPEPACPELQCPPAPRIPPCPNLSCPEPVCPAPVCPSPKCPQPVCPAAHCSLPTQSPCPACPACRQANVSCPQPVCPPAVCPKPHCPAPTCPQAPPCPAGGGAACGSCLWKVLVTYDHFQGVGFYKAYKTKVDWFQAKALCIADGGHLAIINSPAEQEILKTLYRKSDLGGWNFIGFHDLNEEKRFETVLGEPLSSTGYVKWRNGQPDNFGNEDCGSIDENAELNDGNCNWKTGYICEVPEKKALGL